MTRKDYQLIAGAVHEALRRSRSAIHSPYVASTISHVTDQLVLALRGTNPRFNAERFVRACLEGSK